MSKSHLAFRNFRQSVIAAAVELFAAKPWRDENEDQRQTIGQTFADAITTSYGCAPVQVIVHPNYVTGYEQAQEADGWNDAELATIAMRSLSCFRLMKHVREHVLTVGGALPVGDDPQEDPFRWAASLFYSVKPVMYRARVREGRIEGTFARDTYSADSWAKLEQAGFVVNGDRLTGSADQWKSVLDGTYVEDTSTDSLADEDETDVDESDFEAALSGEPTNNDGLDALNRDQVRALCVANGIPRQGRNRDGLVAALREAGVSA